MCVLNLTNNRGRGHALLVELGGGGDRRDATHAMPVERGGGGGGVKQIQIQIQNNFIDTVHIINTYWVISSIKFNR